MYTCWYVKDPFRSGYSSGQVFWTHTHRHTHTHTHTPHQLLSHGTPLALGYSHTLQKTRGGLLEGSNVQIAGERVNTPKCGNFFNFWVHLSARCAKWNVRKIQRNTAYCVQDLSSLRKQSRLCLWLEYEASSKWRPLAFTSAYFYVFNGFVLALILGDFTRYIPRSFFKCFSSRAKREQLNGYYTDFTPSHPQALSNAFSHRRSMLCIVSTMPPKSALCPSEVVTGTAVWRICSRMLLRLFFVQHTAYGLAQNWAPPMWWLIIIVSIEIAIWKSKFSAGVSCPVPHHARTGTCT